MRTWLIVENTMYKNDPRLATPFRLYEEKTRKDYDKLNEMLKKSSKVAYVVAENHQPSSYYRYFKSFLDGKTL